MPSTTPQILRQGLFFGWVLSACLVLIAIWSAREDRQAIQKVGKNTASSVIAAEHIKSALSAMDANAANELLGAPGHAAQSTKAYEERRKEASKALIAAAENISEGDDERAPLEKLELALGEYEVLVQQARDYHDAGDPRQDAAFLSATAKMDDVLWPAADALDQAGLDQLEVTYERRRTAAKLSLAVLTMVGLVLLAVLTMLQAFLSRRTNRVFNVPLIACTLLAFAFWIHALQIFTVSMHSLKVAREDAFTSLHVLWRARAVAYRASADESRLLLMHSKAAAFERDFAAQIDSLAKLPEGASYEQAANRAIAKKKPSEFTGYLADELNNITFEGEADMAKATLIALRYYVARHDEIRALDKAGKHQDAVALALGNRSGQNGWAFEQFDSALGKTLAINQEAFDQAIESGFQALSGFQAMTIASGVSLCIFLWLGIRPRLREYQV
jgi:hypothetical protein